jgi:hypothetical protein
VVATHDVRLPVAIFSPLNLTALCICSLLTDLDASVQEQAWNIVRNLAENEPGIDMVIQELGAETLFASLLTALGSSNEDVVLQVRPPLTL